MKLLIENAKLFAENIIVNQLPPNLYYHNIDHTFSVFKVVSTIAFATGLSPEIIENLQLSALFHDTGFMSSYYGHEKISCTIARDYLSSENLDSKRITSITETIQATDMVNEPITIEQKIIRDADVGYIGFSNAHEIADLLRKEWLYFLNKNYTDQEWYKSNILFLEKHKYFTKYSIDNFSQYKNNLINYYKNKIL